MANYKKFFSVGALVVLGFVAVSFAQHVVERTCPQRQILQNFDRKRYSGRWYELLRYDNVYETGCDCVTADYAMRKEGGIKVKNCCSRLQNATIESYFCIYGKAVYHDAKKKIHEGRLDISFGIASADECAPGQTEKAKHEPNYRIFDTDYDNFSIVYWCKDRNDGQSVDAFWLLSRTPQLNPDVEEKVNYYIDTFFDRNALTVVEQDRQICGTNH